MTGVSAYGYQIWQCIPKGVYRGDGAYGQFAIVAPEKDLVIATLTGTEDMSGLMAEIWKHLLPACADVDIAARIRTEHQKKSSLRLRFRKGMISKCAKNKERISGVVGTYLLEKMRSSWKRYRWKQERRKVPLRSPVCGKMERADTFLWIPPLGVQ